MTDEEYRELLSRFRNIRAEERSYLDALKKRGARIAGVFCSFVPLEILDAAGICSVNLRNGEESSILLSGEDLPGNLCPLIQSGYGELFSPKSSCMSFSELIIGETSCDGKKKMYELLAEKKELYLMQLPQGADRPYARKMWIHECRRLLRELEKRMGRTICGEELRAASRARNSYRLARLRLMQLLRRVPAPLSGEELFLILEGTERLFPLPGRISLLCELTAYLEERSRLLPEERERKRILLTGCPIGGVSEKTLRLIESAGASVVCLENCGGLKEVYPMVDIDREDIMEAIADRCLEIGCAVMDPNRRRLDRIRELSKEYRIDGIVDIVLRTCHSYSVERFSIRELSEGLKIPYSSVEVDYSRSEIPRLETRMEAFLELL